jgi:hypothetical protein
LFYVYGVFIALTGLLIAGFAIVPAILIPATASRARPEDFVAGGVFLAIFGVIALFLLAKAALMILTGRALGRRTSWTLCMVGACVPLMNIPLGTALGVFAIMVLQRPAVKARLMSGT